MQKQITIQAQKREIAGRKASRKLARLGFVPGVLYGGERPPVNFQIDPRRLDTVVHGGSTTLFKVEIEGIEKPVATIIKDLQYDPLTGKVIHADLFRISMDRAIHVKVPVHIMGTAKGVKQQGGVLDFVTRTIDVSCLPTDIPERFDVDVSELELGRTVRVSDLTMPERVTLHTDPTTPIASVVAPAAEKAQVAAEGEAAAAPAEAAAEPEVIRKGKAEAEGEKEGGKEGGREGGREGGGGKKE